MEHQSLLGAGRCVHAAYRCPLREFLVFQQSSLTCEKRLPQSQCLLPDKGETHGGLGQRARGCKQGPFSFAWELITALASTRAQHPAATPTFPSLTNGYRHQSVLLYSMPLPMNVPIHSIHEQAQLPQPLFLGQVLLPSHHPPGLWTHSSSSASSLFTES